LTERPPAPAHGGRDGAVDLSALRPPFGPEEAARRAEARGALYFAEHQLRRLRSYAGTVLGVGVGTPVLYLLAMGIGLAGLVDAAAGPGLGVPYLHFVAPALLVSATMMAGAEENSYTVMAGFKWQRLYLAARATPLSAGQLAAGHTLAATARYLLTSGVYYGVLLLFGAVPQPATGWLLVPLGVLAGNAFGLPVMAFAARLTEDRGEFALLQRLVVVPLFLFSGTFFPLSALPAALQWLGWVSPLWHATQLGRVLAYGLAEPAWLTVLHVACLAALAVAGWLLARRAYARRLDA
jgi:lipooligosaccharide transport system permease protein